MIGRKTPPNPNLEAAIAMLRAAHARGDRTVVLMVQHDGKQPVGCCYACVTELDVDDAVYAAGRLLAEANQALSTPSPCDGCPIARSRIARACQLIGWGAPQLRATH